MLLWLVVATGELILEPKQKSIAKSAKRNSVLAGSNSVRRNLALQYNDDHTCTQGNEPHKGYTPPANVVVSGGVEHVVIIR